MLVEIFHLILAFDPLGNHLHARLAAKGDGGIQHAAFEVVGAYGIDEHLVDLDLADPQALQVGKATVAGPEVIQLEVIALCLQGGDLVARGPDVDNGLALGQFEGEPGRRGPLMAQQQIVQV